MARPSFDELRQRLEAAKSKSGYDDRHACSWQGYLAALVEWDLITPDEHLRLIELVPTAEPNPAVQIFLD